MNRTTDNGAKEKEGLRPVIGAPNENNPPSIFVRTSNQAHLVLCSSKYIGLSLLVH